MTRDIYIVTATGTKENRQYCTLSRVVTGTKSNGDTYTFIDSKTTIHEAESLPFGKVLEYETKRVEKAKAQ